MIMNSMSKPMVKTSVEYCIEFQWNTLNHGTSDSPLQPIEMII